MTAPALATVRIPDEELIARVREGDMSAYAALWTRYQRQGCSAARRMTRSGDSSDVVAESFARILFAIQRGNGPRENFAAYLLATIRTVAARSYRSSVEIPVGGQAEIEAWLPVSTLMDPAVIVGVFDDPWLEQAFRSLPDRWRYIIWSRTVEDVSIADLSAALGMKPAAVAALMYRARKGLRREWDRLRVAGLSRANSELADR